jgi:hypothetical protein
MNTQTQNEIRTEEVAVYQTPEIVDYGTVDALTQSGGNGDPDALGASNTPA